MSLILQRHLMISSDQNRMIRIMVRILRMMVRRRPTWLVSLALSEPAAISAK